MTTGDGKNLLTTLRDVFGFDDFRPGQRDIVEALAAGRDVLGVLPTGAGKSLCYQLPALMRPGVTLVVSPLISLMKDQVDGLERRGLPATFVNSSLSFGELRERLDGLRAGRWRLLYVAPERFKNGLFRSALRQVQVSCVAIDEAHCISMWGHDFRPDYRQLRAVVDELGHPQVVAVTATATPEVRDDILAQLGLGEPPRTAEPIVVVRGFARPNLALGVRQVSSHEQKFQRCVELLRRWPTAIVYCSTRSSVEKVAARLQGAGVACVAYHAGLDDEVRKAAQDRFMGGEVPVAVATNAFGMGVDRADLRAVIHFEVPGSMESYYQEAGRAGRDGLPSACEILFNHADVRTQQFFIDAANPSAELVGAVRRVVIERCSHGPVELTASAVADALGPRTNRMAVDTVLRLLERAGLLERGVDGGSGSGVVETVAVVAPDADLAPVVADVAAKRDSDRARLKRMLRYVETRSCRHGAILGYFGDPEAGTDCGTCDNCRRERGEGTRPRRLPTAAEWTSARSVLACVGRHNGRFGRGRVTEVLAGSRNQAVLSAGLDRSPFHGAMAGRSQPQIRMWVDLLVEDGALETVGDEYPTLRLTERGRQLLGAEGPTELALPEPKTKAKAKPAPGPKISHGSGSGSGSAVVETLRIWRGKRARERGVPAYLILHNATIDAIAAAEPSTLDELAAVKGMGPAKVAALGSEILELVAKARQGQD